jgi:hypothetical protein
LQSHRLQKTTEEFQFPSPSNMRNSESSEPTGECLWSAYRFKNMKRFYTLLPEAISLLKYAVNISWFVHSRIARWSYVVILRAFQGKCRFHILRHQPSICLERLRKTIRFEVFTAVTMKNAVFLDMAPCRYSGFNRRFGGTYRLHLQSRKIRERRTSVSRWLQN